MRPAELQHETGELPPDCATRGRRRDHSEPYALRSRVSTEVDKGALRIGLFVGLHRYGRKLHGEILSGAFPVSEHPALQLSLGDPKNGRLRSRSFAHQVSNKTRDTASPQVRIQVPQYEHRVTVRGSGPAADPLVNLAMPSHGEHLSHGVSSHLDKATGERLIRLALDEDADVLRHSEATSASCSRSGGRVRAGRTSASESPRSSTSSRTSGISEARVATVPSCPGRKSATSSRPNPSSSITSLA